MNLLVIDAQAARLSLGVFSWDPTLAGQVSGILSDDEEAPFVLRDGAGRALTELPRMEGLEDGAYLTAVKHWLDERGFNVGFVAHAMNMASGDADARSLSVAHCLCHLYPGVPQVGVVPARSMAPEGDDALRLLAREALKRVSMPLAA
jgi:hypothetical protein